MRVFRLYLPEALKTGAELVLTGERAHYALVVLRLKVGDCLTVFNGQGGEYSAQLVAASRRKAQLKIVSFTRREAESPLLIHLGLALARGERMDLSVQKATELGVNVIAPLLTEHSNVGVVDKAERKRAHWQKIAIAACEQCGRNRIPQVLALQDLNRWLAAQRGGILLDPEGIPFSRLPAPGASLTLLVGPEGGLSCAERRHAQAQGFIPASLGPRILRVETAVVAALSLAQGLWGDGRESILATSKET